MRPSRPSGSPWPCRCFQVTPPSVERYRPLPGPPLVERPRLRAAPGTWRRTRCWGCWGRTPGRWRRCCRPRRAPSSRSCRHRWCGRRRARLLGAEGVAHARPPGPLRDCADPRAPRPMWRVSRRPMFFQVLPRVGGSVDAVAVGDVAAQASFAAAHVEHVGIGRRHGDAADGGGRLLIEERRPVRAAVDALPHAARRGAEIVSLRIAGDARGGQHAASAERTDQAVLHALQELFIQLSEGGMAQKQAGEDKSEPHASYCGTCGSGAGRFGLAWQAAGKRGLAIFQRS